MSGTLYLVATPIGNLEDLSFRALRMLKEADLIACEDTRTSAYLLRAYEIDTPTTSYHKFNEEEKGEVLLGKLLAGENIALISDAGTPAISDPGEILVRKCLENGVPVTSVPGPNACITALTLSGKSTRRFAFEGFLPQETKEKAAVLAELRKETRTIDGKSPEEIRAEEAGKWETMSIADHVRFYEEAGHDWKEAMRLAAKDRGLSKRDIYQALLEKQ